MPQTTDQISFFLTVPYVSNDRDDIEQSVWDSLADSVYDLLKDIPMVFSIVDTDIEWSGQLYATLEVAFTVDSRIKFLVDLTGELDN
jgi:hypothetical protein